MATTARQLKSDHHEHAAHPTLVAYEPDSSREPPDIGITDPTQGRIIGSDPYDDPTQGRKIGSHPYDDPTRGLA